jgi:type IV pilus assembly protein PilA
MEPVPLRGRYAGHFERMKASGRSWLPGWNWAAFLHSTGWFWYRRMYAWSLLNLVAPVLLLFLLIFVVQWFVPEGGMGIAMAAAGVLHLLLVFVLLPLFADSLYLYRYAKDGQAPKPPSSFTAAGAAMLIVVPAAMAWAVAQAQLDYNRRARVSEGLSAAVEHRNAVSEFHANHHRFPEAAEVAPAAPAVKLRFTKSVSWDPARQSVVVTLGEREEGRRFELAATQKEGALEWTCRSIDLDSRYLPASCR